MQFSEINFIINKFSKLKILFNHNLINKKSKHSIYPK